MVRSGTPPHEQDVHEANFSRLSRSDPCKPIAVNPISSFVLSADCSHAIQSNDVKAIEFREPASLIQGVMLLCRNIVPDMRNRQ